MDTDDQNRIHEHVKIVNSVQDKEDEKVFECGSVEHESILPLTATSRMLYMLGDITAGPAYRFTQWLDLVRKRSGSYRSSGFPHRFPRVNNIMPLSAGESTVDSNISLPCQQATEISLWERLGKAAIMDIESSSFSWDMLSSVHHNEHGGSTDQSDDDLNKALEVTVNSGGVVFFALFNQAVTDGDSPKESAAVIKIASSRMAMQSERLGYEFAKWLGVRAPQARVIHNSSPEWLHIKEAVERARDVTIAEGDELGEVTCSELLEALELSRCLFLMNYVHGAPLLESPNAFDSQEAAEKTAAALGRILLLDLIIRNEDRLPCRELRWRGNCANLLMANKMAFSELDALEEAFDSAIKRHRPRDIRALQKERRGNSVDSRLTLNPRSNSGLVSPRSDLSDVLESPSSDYNMSVTTSTSDFHLVAIDSGVPRRPPAGKRANDQANYPKLVELLLNNSEYSSNLLHDITLGKLGSPCVDANKASETSLLKMNSVVNGFRYGFRGALRDLQGFQIFLLTLHQKLDSLLRSFLNIITRSSTVDKDDFLVPDSPSHTTASVGSDYSPSKERANDFCSDIGESELQRSGRRSSSSGHREGSDSSSSPMSRDGWHGKFCKGSGETLRSLRLTTKLRDFHKFTKVDVELNKELEQWNELLRTDAIKLCQENNFNSGFFEASENNSVVDAYELKVRLEHILERIALISDAANTERPSSITGSLFIGGALAAKSVYTLQRLGITHILCLCSNEIGQSDSQYPDLFEYRNFSIYDNEDADISKIFEEACDFIDYVEEKKGRVLVHCFEGRSRSATLVIAFLMLRKNFTLLEAWNAVKRVHRRAQPNDGFARILLDLDRKLHGNVSMEWLQRKPTIKVCPICGKNTGLSSSSLKLHLQKSHKRVSSGSIDSAMTGEILKVLEALKLSRGGSVSPTQRHSLDEGTSSVSLSTQDSQECRHL